MEKVAKLRTLNVCWMQLDRQQLPHFIKCECEAHIKTPVPSHLEICRKRLGWVVMGECQCLIQAFSASFIAKMYDIDTIRV
ncbi:hypothetical protein QD47_12540 [Paenibacillus terrae]|uniref:Uncharacterized protein n=1 Tax=Paenibacillus terrae TaxID=159743 RepID=A0A0D7X2M4_9BACL|nr:hypothetical protein QD47_12540 [Paenibacillus terrae]